MEKNKFYISTTLPYTNSDPHIGFAAEIIKADVIARYYRMLNYEVLFNTGTDEHGVKIFEKANEENQSVKDYCQPIVDKFYNLKNSLNLSFTNFIRTSEKKHKKAAQEFWLRCLKNGDIYKKNYQVKYCVGCEMEKTDSDLQKGKCPFHPNRKIEEINEENYFFRFSKYQKALLEFYEKNSDFVIPNYRLNEIKSFVKTGLNDFSISRLKEKMPNGIEVPGDSEQVMYVWFDALVNYISTLNWPEDEKKINDFWPGLQVCGKDNLRQQSAMWPAMLMSAGLKPPKQILVFGFLTADGKKISKSEGNTVDPYLMAEKYGSDTLRYYLLTDISTYYDGDFSQENLKLRYQTDLANVLGNFASRLSNLMEKNNIEMVFDNNFSQPDTLFFDEFNNKMLDYKLGEALQIVWKKLRLCDEKMTKSAPWKMTEREEIEKVLKDLACQFYQAVKLSSIFIPKSSADILEGLEKKPIKKISPIFPKLN